MNNDKQLTVKDLIDLLKECDEKSLIYIADLVSYKKVNGIIKNDPKNIVISFL